MITRETPTAGRRLPRSLIPVGILFTAYVIFLLSGPFGGVVDDFFNHIVSTSMILIPAIACFYRAAKVRKERAAWIALGLGCASFFAGDTYWIVNFSNVAEPPYPSVADLFYVLMYPALFVGVTLLAKSRVTEMHKSMWMHGLIAAFAVAALDASWVVSALGSASVDGGAAVATNAVYILGDLFLLMTVIAVWALSGWRPSPVWRLLGGSMILLAIGDSLFLYTVAVGTYTEGAWTDMFWPAALLLLFVAAMSPAEKVGELREVTRAMFVPSAIFASIALFLLVWDHFERLGTVALVFAIAAIVATICEMGMALSENMRLLARSRQEAFTDQLTSMPNRRRLLADLERACREARSETPASFVMFDLNGFKEFNDKFGHPTGDALLRRLGLRLMRTAEPHGMAYRLGGDEFCILVNVETGQLAGLVADAERSITEHGHGYDVTAAFGYVTIPHEADEPAEVMRMADQRMYEHKYSTKSAVTLRMNDTRAATPSHPPAPAKPPTPEHAPGQAA